MQCRYCRNENDDDALFCEECGRDLAFAPAVSGEKKNRALLYVLIAAVVLAVVGIGYYKFFVPKGVAAVVNGEEILLSEVDARMQGVANSASLAPEILSRARYQVLNDLITERIAWQAARKSGIRIAPAEIDAAYKDLAAASGKDLTAFYALIRSQYGGQRMFRRSLERHLAIQRFIEQKISAGIKDPTIVGARVDQWVQEISGRASVRIALAEQIPAAGCSSGGCGTGGCTGTSAGTGGCGTTPKTGSDASPQAKEARKAALAYWKKQHGDETVEAKVLDFGCHIQVDMLKGKKIAKSLLYQNGTISEL